MIGTALQPRRPADHLDAVDAGQAEVEDDDVGVVAGRERRAPPRRSAQVDVVAAGPQVDPERAQDLRLVVDDEDACHRAPLRRRRRRSVSPPPGVSSTASSPPIASTNPRATARPSPTPVAVAGCRRGAGTAGTCARARSSGMPGPRSMTRRSTRPSTAPASTRTGGRPASTRARSRRGWRAPARAAPASATHARERLGDVDVDGARPSGRGSRAAAGTHLLEPDRRAMPSSSAPAWSRLMSSRLPTSALSRSVSSSIVSRNSLRASAASTSTSSLEQAGDRRLDRRERRAQVVRHRREQRGAQLVGLGEPRRRPRPRPAARRCSTRRRELRGERLEDALGRRPRSGRPTSASTSLVVERRPSSASSGVVGRAVAGRRLDRPAVAVARRSTATPSSAERRRELADELRQRVRVADGAAEARPASRPRRAPARPRRRGGPRASTSR